MAPWDRLGAHGSGSQLRAGAGLPPSTHVLPHEVGAVRQGAGDAGLGSLAGIDAAPWVSPWAAHGSLGLLL